MGAPDDDASLRWRAAFMAETEAAHRPASQVLRELMREFVQRQRDAREYDEFLSRKVDIARSSMRAAARMDQLFSDAAARLAEHPKLGRPGKISGTREFNKNSLKGVASTYDGL